MEMPKMTPCVPVPIDKNIFGDLVDKAKDWALMHGKIILITIFKINFSEIKKSYLTRKFIGRKN